jgi:glycosyltransferase involved in cell wall biosynthesis
MKKATDGGVMNQSENPLVTIGLPVFNGAAHLELVIGAILKQSYKNIELIVSDNASTDESAKIVTKFVSEDSRVKFIENDKNMGAPYNFNRVLREASGEFFMWAASDDLHSQDFIEECVGHLLANPNAVLCQTRVAVCLETTERVIYHSNLNSFRDKTAVEARYKETLFNFPAVAIYGMYRAKFAKRIPGFRNTPGGDLLWVQELSLAGDFIQSDKTLFQYIARTEWNSFENDLKNLGSQSFYFNQPILRAIYILFDRINSICRSEVSYKSKVRLIFIATKYSIRTIFVRGLLKGLGRFDSGGLTRILKHKLFWRFLHNPNTEIVDKDLFQIRVIDPTIGIK